MTLAIEILSAAFNKTKELYFPIRTGYWMRMGLISLFGSVGRGGGIGNPGYSPRKKLSSISDFSEFLSKLNTEALNFLSKYGVFIGIGFFVLSLISLFFTYINSVFMFMFIEGIEKKDIKLIKSFGKNHKLALSLFSLRVIIGILIFLIILLIFSPLLLAFFSHDLSTFNYWLLIPMIILCFSVILVMSLFWFLVYDFAVPIMYLKNMTFWQAWRHFIRIASSKKLEIVLYWIIKLALSTALSLLYILLMVPISFLILFLIITLWLIGDMIFTPAGFFSNEMVLGITILCALIIILIFVYAMAVVFVPIPTFMRLYSLEMVKKLIQN